MWNELGLSCAFLDAFDLKSEFDANHWFFRARQLDLPEIEPIAEAVAGWCERNNLIEPWVADTVLRSLTVWSREEAPTDSPWIAYRARWCGALSPGEMRFRVHGRAGADYRDSLRSTKAHSREHQTAIG